MAPHLSHLHTVAFFRGISHIDVFDPVEEQAYQGLTTAASVGNSVSFSAS